MKTELVKEPLVTTDICLKITPESESEKEFINDFFGKVKKMDDVDFITIEQEQKIEEVILYKIQK